MTSTDRLTAAGFRPDRRYPDAWMRTDDIYLTRLFPHGTGEWRVEVHTPEGFAISFDTDERFVPLDPSDPEVAALIVADLLEKE